MAKTKSQKQQEAAWRHMRAEMVDYFRLGSDEKTRRDHGDEAIGIREQLWLDYLALPREWRETAMDRYAVPKNLQDRLDREGVEQQAQDLDESASAVSIARPRMRL